MAMRFGRNVYTFPPSTAVHLVLRLENPNLLRKNETWQHLRYGSCMRTRPYFVFGRRYVGAEFWP